MRRTLVILIALAGQSAWANPNQSVVVFPAEGEAGATAAGPITEVIAEAAERDGTEVTVSAASRSDVATRVGCQPAAVRCLRTIARKLKAHTVIGIAMTSEGGDLIVRVDVVSSRGSPTRASWSIDATSDPAIVAEVRRRAFELFGKDPGPPVAEEPPPSGAPAAAAVDDELPPGMRTTAGVESGASSRSRLSGVSLYAWLTAGAGVALVATGSVFLVGAGNKQDAIDKAPEPETLDDFRALRKLEDEADSRALWGNVLTGAGIVAVGVGATLIVLQMGSDEERNQVSIGPAVFPGGAGFAVTIGGAE